MIALQVLKTRLVSSLTTIPTKSQWLQVMGITFTTTSVTGILATATNFINPMEHFDPPSRTTTTTTTFTNTIIRPMSAFVFPALLEELFWRATLLPLFPSSTTTFPGTNAFTKFMNYYHNPQNLDKVAILVLVAHVLSHPVIGTTVWPRGKEIFCDSRFLLLATIVLGGSTVSYIVSGGSVWAAALTHGIPVVLWRDFFGGEAILTDSQKREENSKKDYQRQTKNH